MNILKDEIIKYIKLGLPVFPVRGKVPPAGLEWKKYQTQLPTQQEVDKWFDPVSGDKGITGIAIALGDVSGMMAIDCDIKDPDNSVETEVLTKLKSEGHIESLTGSLGSHFFVKYDKSLGFTSNGGVLNGVDIKAQGGYVLLPPSTAMYGQDELEYQRYNGNEYKWIKEFRNKSELKDFPIWLLEKIRTRTPDIKKDWKETYINPIENGGRNIDFTSVIGGLLNKFSPDEWATIVWKNIQDTNAIQEKPLAPDELRSIFNSISKKELQRRNSGGLIKDVVVDVLDEEIRIDVVLEQATVCFKIKNIISNLFEANAICWIKKSTGLSHEQPYSIRTKSDDNKEKWARVLGKAFDNKENKELYPWTIIVAKVVHALETEIKGKKQDFLATEIESKKATWLLEPFIQENQINTIFGMGSSGKTLLSLYFAKLICLEKPETNILFIDYEDSAGGWKDKVSKIGSISNLNIDLSKFTYFDSEQMPLSEMVDKVKEVIKRRNIGLVIVDSASLATGESTSDEKAAVRLVSALKLLRITTLLIAHQRKNDGDKTPIGSIQYENQSRNVWNVKGNPDDKDSTIIHIACTHTKANNTYLRREPIGYRVEYTDNNINVIRESAQTYFEDKFTIKQRIQKLLINEGEFDTKGVAESLSLTINLANKNLSEGKKKGMWDNKDGKWFITKGINSKTIIGLNND